MRFWLCLCACFYLVACASRPQLETAAPVKSAGAVLAVKESADDRARHEATGREYIISTQGEAASVAAERMFASGGNIIDAAVAASFAISVERPQSTGIGGGGFMLVHWAKTGETVAVDFRERAPLKAGRDMYLDKKGEIIAGLSTDGILSVAVPGLVKGLAEVQKKYGKLSLAETIQPAIELAEKGFRIYPYLAEALSEQKSVLARFPATKRIFFRGNEVLKEGDLLRQKDLARTLRQIAKSGSDAFYRGPITQAILRESKRLDGILAAEDFNRYEVKWRKPVSGEYRGFKVVSMPPPSSGGTHVIQILNTVENDPLGSWGYGDSRSVHLLASAMQRAFADRAQFMGDPDFVKVPVPWLTSKSYAREIRGAIPMDRFRRASEVKAGLQGRPESLDTTHFSIMDKEGNVVASTQTINGWMGSGVVVPGTGIVLNNEMDDFAAKVGAANLYGAIGGVPNAIVPRKTPLSSMSPTILFKNGAAVMSVGAPGGTRIITCVLQTIVNYLDFGLPLYDSVAAVRFHQQWLPDELHMESPGIPEAMRRDLEAKGHKLVLKPDAIGCRVMAVAREGDLLRGVSDPRDAGRAIGK